MRAQGEEHSVWVFTEPGVTRQGPAVQEPGRRVGGGREEQVAQQHDVLRGGRVWNEKGPNEAVHDVLNSCQGQYRNGL